LARAADAFQKTIIEGLTMRKYILTIITVLPLLLSLSHAAQSWSVDPPAQPWGLSGEDSGTGS